MWCTVHTEEEMSLEMDSQDKTLNQAEIFTAELWHMKRYAE